MRRFRRLLLSLAVLTLALGLAPLNAAAAPESDIPGIPLPGPLAVGRLGGPVYDVVFSVEIPAGHVIIASLSGTPDTDFDLYLFAPGSTTVVNNEGVVAKSTGPTSAESLSYPSRTGGTYYLDLNGASDAEGEYRLTVQVVPDPTPPTVRVFLNDGALLSSSPTVRVAVVGFDDLSGVPDIALSGDGLNWDAWQAASLSATWTFSPGDGVRTLWVKARNGVGLESAPASDSILVDTTAPRALSLSPPSESSVPSLRPVLTVAFSEPIDEASWMSGGLALQGPEGEVVPGAYSLSADQRRAMFTPTRDLRPGYLYFAALTGVHDLAGNPAVLAGTWWIRPMVPTSLSLSVVPRVVTYGSTVVLSGVAQIPVGERAALEGREAGQAGYVPVPDVAVAPGSFQLVHKPGATGTYRLLFAETATAAGSVSPEVPVTVRRWVALRGSGPAITRTGRAGLPVSVAALVRPGAPGVVVSFRLYRWDATRSRWVYAGSRGARTGADGQVAITWNPSAGRWAWQAVAYATPAYAQNQTPLYRWTITR